MKAAAGAGTEAAVLTEINPILAELPRVETKEPTLIHEPVMTKVETSHLPVEEPEPGILRDEDGKVTHVSVVFGELGYDPEIHENTALKILCDGVQVENAHTANTVDGVVKYHKKNEQGRIKTLTVHGKVEIKGI